MGPVESKTDDDFLDYFMAVVADHAYPKLISYVDTSGQQLDLFKVSWDASIAAEQGFYPLITCPLSSIPYFSFVSKSTGLTGYLSFKPIWI